ncbi:MAG: esterase [Deltaproteobacteria bacterium]|nr:esterase [Deltaproteobacteria bacterium]
MTFPFRRTHAPTRLAWILLLMVACSTGACADRDPPLDGSLAHDSGDEPADAGSLEDATVLDSAGADAREDAAVFDVGTDAGAEDGSPTDLGFVDASPTDLGFVDASPSDATNLDAVAPDVLASDVVAADLGFADAGLDAGSDSGAGNLDASPGDSGYVGQPISASVSQWTWVDFPNSTCDDGSPTGIAVNLGTSDDVLFYMVGGGACWDYQTCFVLNSATHGPFGAAQFAAIAPFLGIGPFDRVTTQNPFRNFTFVFVPYCTGDTHAGSRDAVYVDGSGVGHTFHHRGRTNIEAYLQRLIPTFPSTDKLVVAGSSAGGYGTLYNYDLIRSGWSPASGYLVDDAGPILEGDDVMPYLRSVWYSSWGLGGVLDPLCGAACADDLSLAVTTLASRYPNDRFSLLSSLQDQTIRTYMGLTPAAFETALLRMATDVLDPLPNFRYFFVSGDSHTMLASPGSFSSNGTGLWVWLDRQVTNSGLWASTQP